MTLTTRTVWAGNRGTIRKRVGISRELWAVRLRTSLIRRLTTLSAAVRTEGRDNLVAMVSRKGKKNAAYKSVQDGAHGSCPLASTVHLDREV